MKEQAGTAFDEQCDIMRKGELYGKVILEVVFKDGNVDTWKLQQEILQHSKHDSKPSKAVNGR